MYVMREGNDCVGFFLMIVVFFLPLSLSHPGYGNFANAIVSAEIQGAIVGVVNATRYHPAVASTESSGLMITQCKAPMLQLAAYCVLRMISCMSAVRGSFGPQNFFFYFFLPLQLSRRN